ncbi:MAG: hypothetical protein IPK68_01730 [Bdellovibrionales bacterium]|nr:hypothetical protein [Bdellovibrionales bacterium]
MKKILLMLAVLSASPVWGLTSGQILECSNLKTKDNKDGPVIRISTIPVAFDYVYFWVSIEGVGGSGAVGYRVGNREMSYVEADGVLKLEWKGEIADGPVSDFLLLEARKTQGEGVFNITSLSLDPALVPQVMLKTTLGQYFGTFENGTCRIISSNTPSAVPN